MLRESERWVYVPPDGVCVKDERRLLVHRPRRWHQSRVWRSRADDEEGAYDLIEEVIGEVRTAGGGKLVWHTGDRIAPPFMDECLARRGFWKTEDLDVLAFALADGPEPRLPDLGIPAGMHAEVVRGAEGLQEALRVDSEVFSSPPPSGEEFAEYVVELAKLGRRVSGVPPGGDASVALRFVAFVDPEREDGNPRRAAAAAGAQVVDETLRLWGAATREEFRGRGAYRALVLERCRVGRELGATLALTKANVATSGPMLKRAGFERVGTERRHVMEMRC